MTVLNLGELGREYTALKRRQSFKITIAEEADALPVNTVVEGCNHNRYVKEAANRWRCWAGYYYTTGDLLAMTGGIRETTM